MNEKHWKCRNGHILGFISTNADDAPRLMVLRLALDMAADHPDETDVIGPILGQMPVRCSICDDVQVWRVTVPSLVAIMEGLDDATFFKYLNELLERGKQLHDMELEGERP